MEGGIDEVRTASRGVSHLVGPTVFRADGDSRHEGSGDPLRDHGLHQSQRDCPGPRHPLPEDPSYTSCEDQGWIIGEGGGDRVGGQSKVNAGTDQCLKARFRRSWYAGGGAKESLTGFESYYARVSRSLVTAFNSRGLAQGLAMEVHRLCSILGPAVVHG